MTGGAEDRERRHVGAEQRQQEHGRAKRAAGEKIVLGAPAGALMAEGKDADVENHTEIAEDDDGRNQVEATPDPREQTPPRVEREQTTNWGSRSRGGWATRAA